MIERIRKQLESGIPSPVYFIHGEEGYYIDRVVELFENYLPEADRPFNMFTLYAPEKEPDDIMDIAKRYPMMSPKLLVLVKEAQAVGGKWINRLAAYAQSPSPTTVLVVVARGAKISCKEFTDALKKGGGESIEFPKVKAEKIGGIIAKIISDKGLNYEDKVIEMLAEYVGNDLSRLHNEIGKLTVALPHGATVTPESVERNIGISKDYNNFELNAAMAARDSKKALSIVRYFTANQKDNPWVMTSSRLFALFSGTLLSIYVPNEHDFFNVIGTKYSYNALKEYSLCRKNYTAAQLIEIIGLIRKFDGNAKGNGSRLNAFELQEELIMNIFAATGRY